MERKNFIASAFSLFSSISVFGSSKLLNELSALDEKQCLQPHFLKPGDSIGITSPAGFITLEAIQPAVKKLEEWGFKVIIGNTIGKKDFTFGGTDEERLFDFQQMLDDNNIKAILSARGGYGCIRIVDLLNFEKFKANPKWIIGFSDITILHAHINRQFNIASIHSKMASSFPVDWNLAEPSQIESIQSIYKCITGEKISYKIESDSHNREGYAKGELIGGNLRVIENLAASKSDLNTHGKILFLEDTDEYLYNIDRMFWNLKRSGKFDHLKGLIIGGFKIKPDDSGDEFGLTLQQIILEKVAPFKYPVCFNFPVGHQKNNIALKCGAIHKFHVSNDFVLLQED
jgi:muramoyltetrapeptide carboxypeptidase